MALSTAASRKVLSYQFQPALLEHYYYMYSCLLLLVGIALAQSCHFLDQHYIIKQKQSSRFSMVCRTQMIFGDFCGSQAAPGGRAARDHSRSREVGPGSLRAAAAAIPTGARLRQTSLSAVASQGNMSRTAPASLHPSIAKGTSQKSAPASGASSPRMTRRPQQ